MVMQLPPSAEVRLVNVDARCAELGFERPWKYMMRIMSGSTVACQELPSNGAGVNGIFASRHANPRAIRT